MLMEANDTRLKSQLGLFNRLFDLTNALDGYVPANQILKIKGIVNK